jgi:hypothetical protein
LSNKSCVALFAVVACVAATPADARKRQVPAEGSDAASWSPWGQTDGRVTFDRHPGRNSERQAPSPEPRASRYESRTVTRSEASYQPSRREPANSDTGGLGPRPAQWCGWYMRSLLGGGPEYNLAANWRNYGNATSPQVGAVVVWAHHVGIITGRGSDGQWIVKSGNYSGRVHEGARSVAGATFRI